MHDRLLSTREVTLQTGIPEERIRYAIRRGGLRPPALFAGRLAWTPDDVRRLVKLLGLGASEDVSRSTSRLEASS